MKSQGFALGDPDRWPAAGYRNTRVKKIFAVIGVLLAILVIGNCLMALRVEAQIGARVAKLRAAGAPVSIAELRPRPVPDSENAAAHLAAMTPLVKAFARDHAAFYETAVGKAYQAAEERDESATEEQIAAIRQVLDAHQPLEAALAQAAACEQYASRLDYSLPYKQFQQQLLKPVQDHRTLARYVRWRMQVLTAEGQPDEAVRRGVELLRLMRFYGKEPTIVNYLASIAARNAAIDPLYDALAAGPVAEDLHAMLDEELALHDTLNGLVGALQSERALVLEGMGLSSNPARRFFEGTVGWTVRQGYVGALDYFDEMLTAVTSGATEAAMRMDFARAYSSAASRGWAALSLGPAGGATVDAEYRTLATLRALRVYNALRQYAQREGREASGLESLGLPRAATIDPYTDQPLKLKLAPQGWIIYSEKDNGDDGGDIDGIKDCGVAPAGLR